MKGLLGKKTTTVMVSKAQKARAMFVETMKGGVTVLHACSKGAFARSVLEVTKTSCQSHDFKDPDVPRELSVMVQLTRMWTASTTRYVLRNYG